MARKKQDTASYQVRIPRDVLKQIQQIAKKQDQSVNFIMVRALAHFANNVA